MWHHRPEGLRIKGSCFTQVLHVVTSPGVPCSAEVKALRTVVSTATNSGDEQTAPGADPSVRAAGLELPGSVDGSRIPAESSAAYRVPEFMQSVLVRHGGGWRSGVPMARFPVAVPPAFRSVPYNVPSGVFPGVAALQHGEPDGGARLQCAEEERPTAQWTRPSVIRGHHSGLRPPGGFVELSIWRRLLCAPVTTGDIRESGPAPMPRLSKGRATDPPVEMSAPTSWDVASTITTAAVV
jgi:hypothetical protein